MDKEDFSSVLLYETVVDDENVYVDKNALHVNQAYNFMTADGYYTDAFFDDGSAIDIQASFEIVDYDYEGVKLSGAFLHGNPVLIIGKSELAEVNHDGQPLYNFSVINAQGEICNHVLSDTVPAPTGDTFSLQQVSP